MNTIDFTRTGGFPFDQSTLKFLQDETALLQQIAQVFGALVIVSGCVVTGGSASAGIMIINGEVVVFQGGVLATKVIIVDTPVSLAFQNGLNYPVEDTRIATFGDDGVQNNPWANFVRIPAGGILNQLQTILSNQVTDEAAITTLEAEFLTAPKKYTSGNYFIGDVPAPGFTYTVGFGALVPDTNYIVLLSIKSLGSDPTQDLIRSGEIRAKRTNGFDVYLSEPSGLTQNISLDYIILAF